VSAALFGVGALVAVLLLPSRQRLEQLRNPVTAAAPQPQLQPEPQPETI
jgi:hypothetical protein